LSTQSRAVQPSWILSRRVFLVGLAIVYAIAFLSLWFQLAGLIGSEGIAPVGAYLSEAAARSGSDAYWQVPTVFWLNSSDVALHLACGLGFVASLLAAVGIAPALSLGLAWILYLSLVSVGDTFLAYQWDTLLLETGLLACLFAPATRAGLQRPPHAAGLWALRWLLFRLIFSSGAAKLTSGDPSWRDFTALEFHYWTQPLPGPTSYLAHHLPAIVHAGSTLATLAIECVVPWLIFIPGRPRLVAAGAIAALMVLISVTGNYGFFNLLTLVLCVVLLDDAFIRRTLHIGPRSPASTASPASNRSRIGYAMVCILLLVQAGIGSVRMLDRIGMRLNWPATIRLLVSGSAPLRSANSYGLFAVMTTDRKEIEIEGSRDGKTWSLYRFRWKPGPRDRLPGFSQPHMPRLDWQMWFAALGHCRSNPWFLQFQKRLLLGAGSVSALLDVDPFADEPPRYIRSTLHRYQFASLTEAGWWKTEPLRAYCPVLAIEGSRLRRVPAAELLAK
jgi:hypothetical protein